MPILIQRGLRLCVKSQDLDGVAVRDPLSLTIEHCYLKSKSLSI